MIKSLRARLTLVMIVLVLLPMFVVSAVVAWRAESVLRDQAKDIESAHAAALGAKIEALMDNSTQELTLLADVGGLASMSLQGQESTLSDLMAYDPNLHEVSLIDRSSQELVRVTRDGLVPSEDLEPRVGGSEFLVTTRYREIYYGPVEMGESMETPTIKIGVPVIRESSDQVILVLVASVRLTEIWDAVAAEARGDNHQVFVVDGAGRVIAHQNPQVALQGTRFTLAGAVGSPFLGETTGLSGNEVVMATLPIALGDQTFTVVTENDKEDALRQVTEMRRSLQAAAVFAGLVTAVFVTLLLTRLLRPLGTLAQAAQRLGAGDFTVRAEERGGQELVAVGRAFNDMADQLANTVDTLEQRVADRTVDMQLASQLSSQIATILDPDELLPQVVELTKSSFNLYHAHIYLLDEAGGALVLTAGAGEPGRIMRERGHRIAVTANSLVARAARENAPVVVDDVANEPTFLRNPLLPATQSEAAFPLAVRGRVVGVLDVQSEQESRFDRDLQTVLQTMAGQVAVAIANAQLFAESERASRHEAALGAIGEAIQGAGTIEDVLQTAARELGKALGVSQTAIELKLAAAQDGTKAPAAPKAEAESVS